MGTPPTAARSTNGTGISPAAPDHKEKRSTNFTAIAWRRSGDISAASCEVDSFAIVASDLLPRPGPIGAVESGAAAPSAGAGPRVSAAVGRIALGSFFLFTVTPPV